MVPLVTTKAEGAPLTVVSSSPVRELVEAALVDSSAVDAEYRIVWGLIANLGGAQDERGLVRLDAAITGLLLTLGDAVAAAMQGAGVTA